MTDTRTAEQRRRIMQSVRPKNTGPEIAVREILHKSGYRYRLHNETLPGRPDMVFAGRRKAIFVHGCFWHGHGCEKGRLPKSKLDYWGPKIAQNRRRDARNEEVLCAMGWEVLTVWQCEIGDRDRLIDRLEAFLGPRGTARRPNAIDLPRAQYGHAAQ